MTVHGATPDARVFLRPLANPMPLGFIGLAGASIVLTGRQLGWLPGDAAVKVAIATVLIAPPLQLLACVIGFLTRDPVASTSMGTLAVTWLVVGVSLFSRVQGDHSQTAGLLLFFFAGAVLLSAGVAALGNGIASIVLLLAASRFVLDGYREYFGATTVAHASGWLGLAVCVVALYAALALMLEHAGHHTKLPTLRSGFAGRALHGEAATDTVGAVHAEPGVRAQL